MTEIKKNRVIAGILSLIIPGLGQIYRGNSKKGAMILFAAIVIANLNIIVLPLISMANQANAADTLWAYSIPRIVHTVAVIWSMAFWIWAIVDAVRAK
jgi:TM2 domain-containing membrane protein YozV